MSAETPKNDAAASADPPPSTTDADASSGKFKLYTKTGDLGSSCLFNMERRDKDDEVFEALGDVDELGVCVGIARTFATEAAEPDGEMLTRLLEIQSRLLDVGSAVATPLQSSSTADWKVKRVEFAEENITRLEGWIDEYDEELPPLTTFILPSGGKTSVHLHQARTVCRRAEAKSRAAGPRRTLRPGGGTVPQQAQRFLVPGGEVRGAAGGTRRAPVQEGDVSDDDVMMLE